MSHNPAPIPKSEMYASGEYLKKHPTWQAEDSEWKAEQILKMVNNHDLMPQTICEVGCGAGEILRQLQANMAEDCTFVGYEISPQAFELCNKRANKRLRFEIKDITQEADDSFDLLLFIDVIEHIEDYMGFLRSVRTKGRYKIFHIPLEFTSMGALIRWPQANWEDLGHIHYFMKDTALHSLRDAGYTIIDCFYTLLFDNPSSQTLLILKFLRKVTFPISNDLSVRLFGGCELLVLAE
jgi:SAM-dependent methyltransferase